MDQSVEARLGVVAYRASLAGNVAEHSHRPGGPVALPGLMGAEANWDRWGERPRGVEYVEAKDRVGTGDSAVNGQAARWADRVEGTLENGLVPVEVPVGRSSSAVHRN